MSLVAERSSKTITRQGAQSNRCFMVHHVVVGSGRICEHPWPVTARVIPTVSQNPYRSNRRVVHRAPALTELLDFAVQMVMTEDELHIAIDRFLVHASRLGGGITKCCSAADEPARVTSYCRHPNTTSIARSVSRSAACAARSIGTTSSGVHITFSLHRSPCCRAEWSSSSKSSAQHRATTASVAARAKASRRAAASSVIGASRSSASQSPLCCGGSDPRDVGCGRCRHRHRCRTGPRTIGHTRHHRCIGGGSRRQGGP